MWFFIVTTVLKEGKFVETDIVWLFIAYLFIGLIAPRDCFCYLSPNCVGLIASRDYVRFERRLIIMLMQLLIV